MYLSLEFQFGSRITLRLLQADQSIDLPSSILVA